MKTLHILVQDALSAESTTENRFQFVNYYLEWKLEIDADQLEFDKMEAEAYLNDPFAEYDLPF